MRAALIQGIEATGMSVAVLATAERPLAIVVDDDASVRDALGELNLERIARWANQTRSQFDADYGLLIGPFPAPGSDGKVQLAVATADVVLPITIPYTGHPDILKARMAKCALNLLRLKLSQPESTSAPQS
jgi:FixJ family two-component response regulator